MIKYKILLSRKDFRALVSGGKLTLKAPDTEIQIILQDIGYFNMVVDLKEGISTPYQNLTKELI